MTPEANKKLVLKHYDSFVNRQDADAVRQELSADFVDHEMPSGTPPGPEALIQYRTMLHNAFPDLRVVVQDIVAEADRVAVRAQWTGTHRGPLPLMPVPAKNRSFSFTGMVFWRVRGGQIAERWATLDLLSLQQQISAKA